MKEGFFKSIKEEVMNWQFWAALAVASVGLAYLLGPIDLIPDMIGPWAFVDDGIVIILAFVVVKHLLHMVGKKHRR